MPIWSEPCGYARVLPLDKGEIRMRFRLVVVAASIALAISLFGATGALASTRIGDDCAAVSGTTTVSATQLKAAPGPLPLTAPAAGVITSWGFNANVPALAEEPYTMRLKVLRPTSNPSAFTVVGESAREGIRDGSNSFGTRIPIQAGDRLATGGGDDLAVSLYCEPTDLTDEFGVVAGDVPVGSSQTFMPVANVRLALWAAVEPDADNDGFGDETQDACPQSATTQVACPVVTLSTSTSATKKSVTVLITGTTPANVTVKGKVPLGKGKKAKLKGGTKAVAPGAFTKFKLKFPAKLIKRLKELPPSKKLTLKITSTAPNVAAAPTKKTIRVRLKGQGPAS
jgi:hypothetical protein